MNNAVQHIPESMIYEVVDGKPIYYNGYKEYLTGKKNIEDIMGSSYLQSLIISKLMVFLSIQLGKNFTVLTNELGLKFKDGKRAADIAIYGNEQLVNVKKTNRYLAIPPKVIIEIDTKAEIKEVKDSFGYFHKKTDDLLDFGVEKIIWFFTDSQKIMVAEKNNPWQILNWSENIEVINNVSVNLEELIA